MTCPRCGRAVTSAGLCEICQGEIDSPTMLGGGDVTRFTPPPDPDATILKPAKTFDPEATQLRPPVDPDATVLRPAPADADATRIGVPTAPIDADATRIGVPAAPIDPDATRMTPPPRTVNPDATQVTASRPAKTAPRPPTSGDEGPLGIGEEFGRYTIVRMLGIGGMGAVYQAWDKELEVVVALKVIRPEIGQDPAAEAEMERRFKRELLLARQVTHKNVVRIHDLGEIRGIKYITMSFVDGTDLSTLLKRVGRLQTSKILKIMRSVVSGLVAAHAAGVVHRDLKPANIMIDAQGDALIMDFGIARSTGGPADRPVPGSASAAPAGVTATGKYTEATMLGAIVGTLEYMAPEQARGEAVDQRADIYATGLILYDLLAGKRRAEHAGSAFDQLKARMEAPLPAIRTVAADVPDALAAVVTRAIDPDATKRFQTTVEFAAALDRLDDQGIPKPIKRAVSLPIMAGIVTALTLAAGGAFWWYQVATAPVKEHDPISVVIADFDNRTGDPTFDRTLEPMLRRALEGATFITALDRNGIRRTVGAKLPDKLDEAATRELAVKQGLGYVVSGSVEKQGSGYAVTMKATKAVEGTVVSDLRARAADKERVIAAATDLVGSVRKALGDPESDSNPLFAKASLSAASLQLVRYYSDAMQSVTDNKFEDARGNLLKAVELDPSFGVGYQVLAVVSRNLGKLQDAKKYIGQAMEHLDGMTERERLTTRGMLYRIDGDYKQCVKEYGELVTRYKADVIGRNQRALCASYLRDWETAVGDMNEIVKIIPKRVAFRVNLALYSDYSNDFATGEKEGQEAINLNGGPEAYGSTAMAYAQTAQGRLSEAAASYRSLEPVGGLATVIAASGLGDLAAVEGRYAEAVRILSAGTAADVAAKNPDRAAAKAAAQAYAELMRGQKAAAVAAADKALALSPLVKIRFLAGRIFVDAGRLDKAQPLIASLAAELQAEPQAYAKNLEALVAMAGPDARPAIKLLSDANELFPTWIAHFDIGRAYLATKQFAQADSEFDRCAKRQGEVLALFMDEEPTYSYFPPILYYQGQAREGLKLGSAAESYQAYVDLRGKAGEDVLLADARRRFAKLKK
jgi:hypothetical protein